MVRNDGSTTLRTEGKSHVLDHLGRVIFHLSSPRPHFSPFLCQFQWKISKSIRKEAKRRPATACFSLSRNKLKRAKSPMLQGFSHALVRFGGKQKAPERSPRCPHLHLVHFAPLIPGPRPMNFAFFHTKGATGLLLTSPQRSDPGPQWGQKKSEPTHYQIHQFAQSNTYSDVFQSLLSIQRSPVYYTLSFYYSTKRATKCKNIFEAFKFLS